MNRRTWILEGALSALAVVVLVLLSGWSLRKAFEKQKRCALERLQKPAVIMIERAFHLKDDLAIQEVVTALGLAPGIYFACVIGPDGKIMAHSQPANVGQIFRRPDFPVTAHPLAEGQKRWGTLVISASDKALRSARRREMALWSLGSILLWLVWNARSLIWRWRLAGQERRISDLLIMAEDQKQKERREAERQSQARVLWTSRLQSAVERIPQAIMLLDQRQRVATANSSAAQALGVERSSSLVGKSWQEVPRLGPCGKELEKSLASPSCFVECSSEKDDLRLRLETDKDGLSGTWVTFVYSNHPYKTNEKASI